MLSNAQLSRVMNIVSVESKCNAVSHVRCGDTGSGQCYLVKTSLYGKYQSELRVLTEGKSPEKLMESMIKNSSNRRNLSYNEIIELMNTLRYGKLKEIEYCLKLNGVAFETQQLETTLNDMISQKMLKLKEECYYRR